MKKSTPRFSIHILLAGAGILFLLYGYFAWMPTGYERVAGKHAQARKTAREIVQSIARQPLNDSTATPTLSAPGGSASNARESLLPLKDFFATLEELARQSDAVFVNTPDHPRRQAAWMGRGIGSGITRPSGRRLSAAAQPETMAPTSKDQDLLIAEMGCALAWEANRRRTLLSKSPRPQDFISTQSLHALLDSTEDFLLHSQWSVADFEDWPYLSRNTGVSFQWACRMAIARASLQGNEEKAGRLLKFYLAARRLIRAADNPWWWGENDLALAFLPPELEAVSDEGLAAAQLELEKARVTTEQFDAMTAMYAMRFRRQTQIKMDQVQNVGAQEQGWAFYYRGVPHWCAWQALRPILSAQADRVAMACVEGNSQRQWTENRRLWTIEYIAHGIGAEDPTAHIDEERGCFRPSNNTIVYQNNATERYQLALAIKRYRQATGNDPNRLDDLVPAYLDERFLHSSHSLLALPGGWYPAIEADYRQESAPGPFEKAVYAFWEAEHCLPNDPEDLLEYVADSSHLETFRTRFEWIDARLLICTVFQEPLYDPLSGGNWFQHLYRRTYLRPTTEECNEIDRELQITSAQRTSLFKDLMDDPEYPANRKFQDNALGDIEILHVSAVSVSFPLISSDLAELLRAEDVP